MPTSIKLNCDPLVLPKTETPASPDTRKLYEEISLESYVTLLLNTPKYSKYKLLAHFIGTAQQEAFLKDHVLTYDDYKPLIERAKATKFGLLILTIGDKKIVFTANTSIQNELVKLEKNPTNVSTSRSLLTGNNHRLLENNPVAANFLDHDHNYIEQQRAFFSVIASSEEFDTYVNKRFLAEEPPQKALEENEYIILIGKLFTQLYFQALFSNSNYKDKESSFIDDKIAINVGKHYPKILKLYEEIEKCTGKHGLTFGKLLNLAAEGETIPTMDDKKLIPLLYEIMCCIYDEKYDASITDEETIAKEIINLMQRHGARVLPVFEKLSNNINKCFNLLSWLDNSLNIINTLSNFIVYVGEEKSVTEQTKLKPILILGLIHKMRALATLFMREINPETRIVLSFEGHKETIEMDSNSRIMMTNSIPGAVFGSTHRVCPSRDFSYRIIPAFLTQFFQYFTVNSNPSVKPHSAVQNNSWFWNIQQPTGTLTVQSTLQPKDVSLKEHFLQMYKSRLASDNSKLCGLFTFFSKSYVRDTMSLKELVNHATGLSDKGTGSRSNQVMKEMGWLDADNQIINTELSQAL
jgi:hypothetical protein